MADGSQMSPAQLAMLNAQARAAVLANGVEMCQQINSQSVAMTAATPNVINIVPRNVGLLKGFLVEVNGSVTNNGMTTAAARTGFGTLNCLTNIMFQDLNNQQRINTSGRQLGLLNSVRQGFGFGGAYAPNLPNSIGNNFTVQSSGASGASLAAGATTALRQIYWIPLAYAADDLRGAIYANVVNATMNLQLTINGSPVIASGDPLNAIFTGNTGAWSGNVTVTTYQVYLDQLPMGNGGPILPFQDLNTIYELKETTLSGLTANQDFPYGFANFRDFLSVQAIYDNAGVYNVGSDIAYWSLVSANFTQIFKYTPEIAALNGRQLLMADPPPGTYLFDFRRRPISTLQFGNMELNINASAVTAGASLLIGTEAFANVQMLQGASSLSAGG